MARGRGTHITDRLSGTLEGERCRYHIYVLSTKRATTKKQQLLPPQLMGAPETIARIEAGGKEKK